MWNHHWMCVVYQVSLSLTLIFVLLYSCYRHKPSPGSKTGVSTEDNPAYGVSLNTPHKESGVTQSPSSAAPEAVYEMVPC